MKIITLKEPVKIREENGEIRTVTEIKIDRLRGKHLKAIGKEILSTAGSEGVVEPAKILPIVAKIIEIPEEVVDEMDLEDIFAVWEVISSFFEQSLSTGMRSSGQLPIRTISRQRASGT